MERIALCGGTFDPFHLGHLQAPLSVREQFGWSRIVFIPAWQQPFKRGVKSTSPYHRFAMAVLSTNDDDLLCVSDIELERQNVSYTVDTLEALRRENPEATLDWIIGEDNVELLPKWKSFDRLMALANFVVLRRGDASAVPPELQSMVRPIAQRGLAGSICFADNVRFDVSATEVRSRLGRGDSVQELVHPAVMHYIEKNRLYQTSGVTN